VKHRYSHFEARFLLRVGAAPAGLAPLEGWEEQRWVPVPELESYPRPRAHIEALRRLGLES
jgi:hypothetical protein